MTVILVVDDNPNMATLIQEMVELAGYDAEVAYSGLEGHQKQKRREDASDRPLDVDEEDRHQTGHDHQDQGDGRGYQAKKAGNGVASSSHGLGQQQVQGPLSFLAND